MKTILKKSVTVGREFSFIIIIAVAVATFSFATWFLMSGELKEAWYYLNRSYYYNDTIVLFYGEGCEHCVTVDRFIATHKVDEKIKFERLEVFHNKINENILADKAQVCGFEYERIGVPFLWDGVNKRCFMGYVDINAFFDNYIK